MFSKAKTEKERKRKAAPPTIISTDLTISGNLVSDGEIQIDGVVDGDVDSARLSIGEKGKINGSVKADRALIRGRVNGQIRGREVTLTRTAKVKGDIYHDTLSIEPGAQIDGHCRRLNAVEAADQDGVNINLVVSDGLPTGKRS
jgi:cytoskeletal protein CcmA (bactofilin family)